MNVNIYKDVKSEQELVELMIQEPDWDMLKDPKTVEMLFHLNGHFDIVSKQGFLKLPNIASSVAYYVDNLMQKINLYNSKIHVLSELNKNIFCEINYSKKYLNYNPKIDLKIGLRRNFMWMKENKNLIF